MALTTSDNPTNEGPYFVSLYNRANNILDCVGLSMEVLRSGYAASKTLTSTAFAGSQIQAGMGWPSGLQGNVRQAILDALATGLYVTTSGGTTLLTEAHLDTAVGYTFPDIGGIDTFGIGTQDITVDTDPARDPWNWLDVALDEFQYCKKSVALTPGTSSGSTYNANKRINYGPVAGVSATHEDVAWGEQTAGSVTSAQTLEWAMVVTDVGGGNYQYDCWNLYDRTIALEDISGCKGSITLRRLYYSLNGAYGIDTNMDESMPVRFVCGSNTVDDTVVEDTDSDETYDLTGWPTFTSGQEIEASINASAPADSPVHVGTSGDLIAYRGATVTGFNVWWTIESL